MVTEKKDDLFAQKLEQLSNFKFDDKVAGVFPDMLKRSIPGYPAIINMIGTLTGKYAQPGSNLYDLGCSLGASALSMQHGLRVKNCHIYAIDNSQAMIDRCRKQLKEIVGTEPITCKCEDITKSSIENASVVVMNFTLQFISPDLRCALLKKIYQGMNKGGILILSEKVKFADQHVNSLLIDIYHAFKKANGYSELEISQKRTALEKVLIPETAKQHRDRLVRAGFTSVDQWFQCFNFMSMMAIK